LKRLFSAVYNLIDFAAGIAQLVRAPDCGSGGRGFETHYPPLPFKRLTEIRSHPQVTRSPFKNIFRGDTTEWHKKSPETADM
jgi:hypothetical protein